MKQPLNPPTQSPPSSSSKDTNSGGQKRKIPTAQELIAHYEAQGLENKEASVKVIEDLQKVLFRVVASNSSSGNGRSKSHKSATEISRKLDIINARLVKLDMKVDSKPGYGETLAIGVASGAALRGVGSIFPHVVRAVGQMWSSVRAATSTSSTSH